MPKVFSAGHDGPQTAPVESVKALIDLWREGKLMSWEAVCHLSAIVHYFAHKMHTDDDGQDRLFAAADDRHQEMVAALSDGIVALGGDVEQPAFGFPSGILLRILLAKFLDLLLDQVIDADSLDDLIENIKEWLEGQKG